VFTPHCTNPFCLTASSVDPASAAAFASGFEGSEVFASGFEGAGF
jgi:hypothetical protein